MLHMGQQYCSNVAHLSVCEKLIRIPSKISCTFSITHSAGTLFDFSVNCLLLENSFKIYLENVKRFFSISSVKRLPLFVFFIA